MWDKLKQALAANLVVENSQGNIRFNFPGWALLVTGIMVALFISGFFILFYNVGVLQDRTGDLQERLAEKRTENEELLEEKRQQEEDFLEESRIREEEIQEIIRETEKVIKEMEEIRELRDEVYDKVDGLDPPEGSSTSNEESFLPEERSTSLSRGGPASLETADRELENADSTLEAIQRSISEEKQEIQSLLGDLEEYNNRMRAIPSIWPTRGRITSGFGYRSDPVTGGSSFHSGIDISNSHSTPVYATADGRVSSLGYRGSYGKILIIDHGYGYQTYYAHLSGYAVSSGQQVSRGEIIGYMGNTGRTTGSHLHYEVRINGNPVNPAGYF